jgi:hypothetical protein
MKSDPALVCNMDVFTPARREAHIHATTQLVHLMQQVQEIEHGYEFTFLNETDLIVRIAEFIANERLCCPFLNFTLHVPSSNESPSLSLTGPLGTLEFLRAEFNGAF